MALALPVKNLVVPNVEGSIPQSTTSKWQTVITAGGPAVQDAATITSPTTQITAATRSIFKCLGAGTTLLVRLGYDGTLTAITSPVIKVFGRATSAETWQVLKTRSGGLSATITAVVASDTIDVAASALTFTAPDYSTLAFDRLGCDEILIGVETALAGATGTTATSIIQVKLI